MALETRRKEGGRRTEWLENSKPHDKNSQFTFIWTFAVLGKFLLEGVKPLATFCLVRGLLFVISLWLFCKHSKLVQQEARFSLCSLHKVMLDTFNFVPYIHIYIFFFPWVLGSSEVFSKWVRVVIYAQNFACRIFPSLTRADFRRHLKRRSRARSAG